ncbi:hypothetical protein Clacol_010370 [Clathrus columnatus]|uniref:Uncharacterized protein n=1 Tax=Clathrus columnatus TaxID=1419009 RepID=A0AAV5ATJ3_9AGAM|nr:hypothetical protein Clacol_010370 [Clathrus columnatus]
MSFPENPAQYIQSTFGRLHESIIAEMGESNDLVNNENEDPDLEPDLGATADHIVFPGGSIRERFACMESEA